METSILSQKGGRKEWQATPFKFNTRFYKNYCHPLTFEVQILISSKYLPRGQSLK
ncbi:uncharacterized protein G2W53_025949 [Senna tora]|uniref:Uncharacterized protein n=1 Tax=Senna tora TaxID=362788 RepID=A0A834TGF3_9FABA|nr:uncharacterized protein G2W53_025949 [Senna tora]